MKEFPDWFSSVPIFEASDPSFFLLGYFSGGDDDTDLSAEFSTKKIELFARQRRLGWDAWGAEVEN